MNNIYLTNKSNHHTVKLNPNVVAGVIVEMCGGGYTTQQTAKAMTVRADLEKGKSFDNGKFIIFKKGE